MIDISASSARACPFYSGNGNSKECLGPHLGSRYSLAHCTQALPNLKDRAVDELYFLLVCEETLSNVKTMVIEYSTTSGQSQHKT